MLEFCLLAFALACAWQLTVRTQPAGKPAVVAVKPAGRLGRPKGGRPTWHA